jgi:hypothetical protein
MELLFVGKRDFNEDISGEYICLFCCFKMMW